jgi:2-keto-4-pentenoate hydratase/2-oxohepta-3-ene-1,7-dioic acid hydratase in catechol pathway
MRLATYRHEKHGESPRVGVVQGDRILDAAQVLGESEPLDMLAFLDRGPEGIAALAEGAERFAEAHRATHFIPPEVAVANWECEMFAPIPRPRSLRDFYAFEQHVATAHKKRGREVPPAWYEIPVFYYGHTGSILGPEAGLPKPTWTEKFDFELEIACVIGKSGRDIAATDAADYIAGYTIMNDWSARDIQRQEMSVGLGPAKAKDFATSLGPFLVTPDEVADRFSDGRLDLAMIGRINGEEVTHGNAKSIHWTFADMIARASQGVDLLPGDVIGSGTVGGGCLLELGEEVHPWLTHGDEVELEIERLGRLRNRIV